MVDRRDVGSWLEGQGSRDPDRPAPGVRLGLPADGPGSVARFGRRLLAIAVDYVMCMVIATAFGYHLTQPNPGGRAFIPLAVFLVENLILVGTIGATLGHRLLGLRVVRLAGGAPGPLLGAVRSVLLCLAVPALIWDRDQRGVHDRVPGTVLIRD